MINLQVDEAYAFDYLSILEVKYEKNLTKESFAKYQMCSMNLEAELLKDHSLNFYKSVLCSQEYKDLKECNEEVFDLVDKVKTGQCSGLDVDMGNYRRFQAKQKLQKKFFTTELVETKIGYENIIS